MKLQHHQLQYVEFACSDFAATKAFYEAAFGWTFTDYGEAGQVNYIDFTSDHASGGFYIGEVVRGSIVPMLYSENIEASLEAVRAAGGTITRDIFSFPGGRRFHFTDPAGNELAVWSDQV